MSDILSIGIQCNSLLQIMGLLIVAILMVVIAIIIYKVVRFIVTCFLHFRKIDIAIDENDFHMKTHLRQD